MSDKSSVTAQAPPLSICVKQHQKYCTFQRDGTLWFNAVDTAASPIIFYTNALCSWVGWT